MKPLVNLIADSEAQEKFLLHRVWKFLAAFIIATAITIFLFMSGLFIIPLLLAGIICVIDLGLTIGLIIAMFDDISEAKYQNVLLGHLPPAIPE